MRAAANIALSFFIPFLILVVALVALNVTPFGDNTLAISDGQFYINGLVSHSRMLQGEEGFFYSLEGFYNSKLAVTAWGELNPVKIMSLLANIDSTPHIFTWVCVVNMCVCGLTMYIFLSGVFGHKYSHLLFSTAYALMGFNAVNCHRAAKRLGNG